MSIDTAIKCFDENLQLFGHSTHQPEKFNLYNGLSNLAQEIQSLRVEIRRLHSEIDDLRRGR